MKTLVELMEERQKQSDEFICDQTKKSFNRREIEVSNYWRRRTCTVEILMQKNWYPKQRNSRKQFLNLDIEIEEKEYNLSKAAKSIKEVQKGKTQMEYLKTKEAALDFARILMDNEGSSNSARKAWEANLVEKGVTDVNKILPEPVLIAIQMHLMITTVSLTM